MTLSLEDGSGVDGADSFIDVDGCNGLATDYYGHSLTHSAADKEAALRRAFVYMGALDWKADANGLSLWPTFGGTIPHPVKIAQMALARLEVSNVGALAPDVTLSGKKVLTGVKGITWQVQGGPNTVEAARPVVTFAMDLLAPYLASDPSKVGGRTTFLDRG